MGQRSEREAVFQPEFREDLRWWVETNRSTALRILVLVEAVLADPFQGIGKPERLKHQLAGAWSQKDHAATQVGLRGERDANGFLAGQVSLLVLRWPLTDVRGSVEPSGIDARSL